MEIIAQGRRYALQQQGRYGEKVDEPQPLDIELRIGRKVYPGWHWVALVWVIHHRTVYLYNVQSCDETKQAGIRAKSILVRQKFLPPVRVIDDGHIYEYDCIDGSVRQLVFVKRSSGMIMHPEEWPGTQTQEVMRALIKSLFYRYFTLGRDYRHATTGEECEWLLKEMLLCFEARAYRRKVARVNRHAPEHPQPNPAIRTGVFMFDDVPLQIDCIEDWPIGGDGHIRMHIPEFPGATT